MADLLVRDIEPDLYERLRKTAKAQGKSLSKTVRDLLAETIKSSKTELWVEADRIRAMTPHSDIDSTHLIRQDRDNDEPYR